jgi:hypothetical protein
MHKDLTGNWRSLADLGLEAPARTGVQADPLAQQRQDLEARETELQRQREATAREVAQRWEGGVAQDIGSTFYAEIDKALAPIKEAQKNTPKLYEALRKDFHDTVINTIHRNRQAWQMYMVKLAEARKVGTPDAAQGIARDFIKMATPAIAAHKFKFLKDAGIAVKSTSDVRHAELKSIDSHRGTSNGGSAPAPNKGNPLARMPGESASDFNLRQLRG